MQMAVRGTIVGTIALALVATNAPAIAWQVAPVRAADQPVATVSVDPALGEASISRMTISRSRLTLPVRIDDKQWFDFVVDTGAERTLISTEAAAELMLAAEGPLRLATITGAVVAPSFFIERLDMGAIDREGVIAPALSRHDMGIDGLIGIDSLADHSVVFDFKNRRLEVRRSAKRPVRLTTAEEIVVIGARRQAGRLILSGARINGRRIDVVVDTGAQGSIGNLALQRLVDRRGRRTQPTELIGVSGDSITGQAGSIAKIEFDGMTLVDAPVAYADTYALRALGLHDKPALLLGMDALTLFDRVEIDFARRRVSFTMPRQSARPSPLRLAVRASLLDR